MDTKDRVRVAFYGAALKDMEIRAEAQERISDSLETGKRDKC